MSSRDKLLLEIETFLARVPDLSIRQFGQRACGDHNLVLRLREGSDVTTGTADRVRAFMASYKRRGRKDCAA